MLAMAHTCEPEAMNNDYDYVRTALGFITDNWREQPSLEDISAAAGVSPGHMQRIFTRWAGLSPKAFL